MNFTKIDTVQNEIKKQNNKICRKKHREEYKIIFSLRNKDKIKYNCNSAGSIPFKNKNRIREKGKNWDNKSAIFELSSMFCQLHQTHWILLFLLQFQCYKEIIRWGISIDKLDTQNRMDKHTTHTQTQKKDASKCSARRMNKEIYNL